MTLVVILWAGGVQGSDLGVHDRCCHRAYRTAEIVTRSAHAPDTLQGMNMAIDGLWQWYIDGPAAVIVDFLEQTHDVGRTASTPDRPTSRNDQQASLLGVTRFADGTASA